MQLNLRLEFSNTYCTFQNYPDADSNPVPNTEPRIQFDSFLDVHNREPSNLKHSELVTGREESRMGPSSKLDCRSDSPNGKLYLSFCFPYA